MADDASARGKIGCVVAFAACPLPLQLAVGNPCTILHVCISPIALTLACYLGGMVFGGGTRSLALAVALTMLRDARQKVATARKAKRLLDRLGRTSSGSRFRRGYSLRREPLVKFQTIRMPRATPPPSLTRHMPPSLVTLSLMETATAQRVVGLTLLAFASPSGTPLYHGR